MRKPPEPTFKGWSAIETYQSLSQQILGRATEKLSKREFLLDLSGLLLEFSGCDRLELWVRQANGHYLLATHGRDRRSFVSDCSPWPEQETEDRSTLGSLRRRVIEGDVDASLSCFTARGSFWTPDARQTELLSTSDENLGDARSLLLIPIRIEERCAGLLQLESASEGFFAGEEVRFYELVTEIIGIAIAHRRAQLALRERVKELTCLYGIARIVARPGIGEAEALQEIVEILPPAWLHPEVAVARICLPAGSYVTSSYQESQHRQRADVAIRGETVGFVEVAYVETQPDLDEGPFLTEERHLIEAVAREVAGFLERSTAEQEKSHLQDQLRHADRLATIGQLAAGVAHELNEPLGNILGFAQLAQKAADLPAQVEKDMGKIVNASLYAREIIKKLMVFARQIPSKMERINLNEIVEEGLYFFEARCAKAGVELLRRFSPNLPPTVADAGQLNQALVNLVVNALQAMPEGGTLTVETSLDGEHVMLSVADTGHGMTEEVRRQIFIPFFTTKDVDEGTGLGLPVVHGIVSSHRGTINVTSGPGTGTRFDLRLPVSTAADAEEAG
ncbi:MAG: sensor histidine kinase [Planctomycetota bacterium]